MLFRRDPRWRGGDVAHTIDLGGERSLWLFGDTFVAAEPGARRPGSAFLHSSVALQTGRDPRTASMQFRWGGTEERPDDFFPRQDAMHYFWPAHGARLGDRVLVFGMAVGPPSGVRTGDVWGGEAPFTVEGWRAFWVTGVDGPVETWATAPLEQTPDLAGVVGVAVLVDEGHLYAWVGRHGQAYLCRWPVDVAATGDLLAPDWWAGQSWTPDGGAATVVLSASAPEFTVHRAGPGRYVAVDVAPFAVPECGLHVREAPRPEGPWTERREVFRIPEAARRDAIVYAGKAHPELEAGRDLALTYMSNSSGLGPEIFSDESLYYPRFVRIRQQEP